VTDTKTPLHLFKLEDKLTGDTIPYKAKDKAQVRAFHIANRLTIKRMTAEEALFYKPEDIVDATVEPANPDQQALL